MKTESACAKRILIFFTLIATLFTPLVRETRAIEREGISFPDTVSVDNANLLVNGTGVRKATIFGIRVYVGVLYLSTKAESPGTILASTTPKKLVMHFVRDLSKEDILAAWKKGFEANNPNQPLLASKLDQLIGSLGDMQEGKEIALTFTSQGVTLESGSTQATTVADPEFATAVLRIWLGDSPPDTGLQTGLLGKE